MSESESTPDYDTLGWVLASGYRKQVLRSLTERPKIPSRIAEENGVKISHVSRALSELQDRGLVELLVPEDRKKGRLYGLTDAGEAIVSELEAD